MSTENLKLLDSDIEALQKTLNLKYAAHLKNRFFELVVAGEPSQVSVTLTLQNQSRQYYYPVMGRINAQENDLSQRDAALLILDYMDCYFEEYFKDDEGTYLTIDWAYHKFDGIEFQIKGQIFNLAREKLADELLAKVDERV